MARGWVKAVCWRSGEIGFIRSEHRPPHGAIVLAEGHVSNLKRRIQGRARLSYNGRTWLVPGIPEAAADDDALDAAIAFRTRLLAEAA